MNRNLIAAACLFSVLATGCSPQSESHDPETYNLAAVLRDMRKDVAALDMKVGYPGKHLEVPESFKATRLQKFKTAEIPLKYENAVYDAGQETIGYIEAESKTKPLLFLGESLAEAMNEDPKHFEQTNLLVEVRSGLWKTPLPLALRYFRFKGAQPDKVRFIEEIADVDDKVPFSGTEREVKMRNVALRTLRLCMREFLLDGIKRDRLPWSGDLTVSLLANAASFRDADIVKRSLLVLDAAGWRAGDINGIIDYSLWLIISHELFQEHFGDMEFLRKNYRRVAERLESFTMRADKNGLLTLKSIKMNLSGKELFVNWDQDAILFIDWTKDSGSTTTLNAIYYGALEAGAKLAGRVGCDSDAKRWRNRAEKIKALLKKHAWDDKRGLFRFDVEDPALGHFTRHGNIYAVCLGVADSKAELESIGRHLAAAELPQVGTPYVSAYEAMALIKCGRKDDAKALVEKVWGSMLDAGATSFWEGFNPEEKGDERWFFYGRPFGKSLCHAWSAAPAFLLPMLQK